MGMNKEIQILKNLRNNGILRSHIKESTLLQNLKAIQSSLYSNQETKMGGAVDTKVVIRMVRTVSVKGRV